MQGQCRGNNIITIFWGLERRGNAEAIHVETVGNARDNEHSYSRNRIVVLRIAKGDWRRIE
jgi:hypothetical protein